MFQKDRQRDIVVTIDWPQLLGSSLMALYPVKRTAVNSFPLIRVITLSQVVMVRLGSSPKMKGLCDDFSGHSWMTPKREVIRTTADPSPVAQDDKRESNVNAGEHQFGGYEEQLRFFDSSRRGDLRSK